LDTLNEFNPFLGGKTKSQLGRFVGTIRRTLQAIEGIENMIIQENIQEETKMDGIQVTIARSQTTEDSRNTLDKGYHLNPN
jgi:hypothetical protein